MYESYSASLLDSVPVFSSQLPDDLSTVMHPHSLLTVHLALANSNVTFPRSLIVSPTHAVPGISVQAPFCPDGGCVGPGVGLQHIYCGWSRSLFWWQAPD